MTWHDQMDQMDQKGCLFKIKLYPDMTSYITVKYAGAWKGGGGYGGIALSPGV